MIFDPNIFNSVTFAQESAQNASPVAVLGLNVQLFIAQLINFAVVLFVLWKWVFNPVTKRLQKRTEKIEKSLQDADQITKEKQEFKSWREQEVSKARRQAVEIINSAQSESEKVKDKILLQTKTQQAQVLTQTKEQIEMEKQRAVNEAKASLADLVTSAAEKILRQKLNAETDKELIKETLENFKN